MPLLAPMRRTYYGGMILLRADCPECEKRCLVNAESQCEGCGSFLQGISLEVERQSESPRWHRRKPTKKRQAALLEAQESRCYWCGRMFGELVERDDVVKALRVEWDHFIPFSFTGSCDDLEFIAACFVCNGLKNDRYFDDENACRAYVRRRNRWRLIDPDMELSGDWCPPVCLTGAGR